MKLKSSLWILLLVCLCIVLLQGAVALPGNPCLAVGGWEAPSICESHCTGSCTGDIFDLNAGSIECWTCTTNPLCDDCDCADADNDGLCKTGVSSNLDIVGECGCDAEKRDLCPNDPGPLPWGCPECVDTDPADDDAFVFCDNGISQQEEQCGDDTDSQGIFDYGKIYNCKWDDGDGGVNAELFCSLTKTSSGECEWTYWGIYEDTEDGDVKKSLVWDNNGLSGEKTVFGKNGEWHNCAEASDFNDVHCFDTPYGPDVAFCCEEGDCGDMHYKEHGVYPTKRNTMMKDVEIIDGLVDFRDVAGEKVNIYAKPTDQILIQLTTNENTNEPIALYMKRGDYMVLFDENILDDIKILGTKAEYRITGLEEGYYGGVVFTPETAIEEVSGIEIINGEEVFCNQGSTSGRWGNSFTNTKSNCEANPDNIWYDEEICCGRLDDSGTVVGTIEAGGIYNYICQNNNNLDANGETVNIRVKSGVLSQ